MSKSRFDIYCGYDAFFLYTTYRFGHTAGTNLAIKLNEMIPRQMWALPLSYDFFSLRLYSEHPIYEWH